MRRLQMWMLHDQKWPLKYLTASIVINRDVNCILPSNIRDTNKMH